MSSEDLAEHAETFRIGKLEGHIRSAGFDDYMKKMGYVKRENKYYHE